MVVDECHRGSAADDAAWREVLEYFASATQIGMTATPKETRDVSNIEYFGEPIYTYSLRQGIEDGFLAPVQGRAHRIGQGPDGWRPEEGKMDKYGREIEDREYNDYDFDRNLVLEKRTELVAAKITRVPQGDRPLSQRRSSSARTSITPSACGRRWSTPTPTSPPPTAGT